MKEGAILDFPAEYVLDLCGAVRKNDIISSKGELIVQCPHTQKWIEINLAKGGTWHCFRGCINCPGNTGGGILDFYNLFYDLGNRSAAYKAIKESLSNGHNKELARKRAKTVIKEKTLVEIASIGDRDKTYRSLLELLTLSNAHRQQLLARGFTDNDIEKIGFKSLPQNGLGNIAARLYRKGCRIKGVPGFYFQHGQPRLNCFGTGILIPYKNEKGLIQALQIRRDIQIDDSLPEKEKEELKKQRYRWLTSSGKNGGCAARNFAYFTPPPKEKNKVVYVTEGGLKAAAAAALSGGWFVAIPGVNCFEAWESLLEYFKEEKVEIVVDAFDRDRLTNKNVAENIKKIRQKAKEFGYAMKSWEWDERFKGVDDYLLHIQKIKREKGSQ